MTTVLLVDDDEAMRRLMGRWLDVAGYRWQAAADAVAALELMAHEPSDVALCDIVMPGHNGFWLAEQLRQRYPHTALVMETGQDDLASVITSLHVGVVDYLVKPFAPELLVRAIERGVRWHEASIEAQRRLDDIEHEAEVRRRQLAEALSLSEINSRATVHALLGMLTLHDHFAYEHGLRVAAMSSRIAVDLGIGEPLLGHIEIGAMLHDVGKISVPESVLSKPVLLSPVEQRLMRGHAEWGGSILSDVPFLAGAAAIVACSHERLDGSGYPAGLKGDAIPIGARIVAVADSYDAMTAKRIYHEAIFPRQALADLLANRGVLYDATVVDAVARLLPVEDDLPPLS